MPLRPRSPTAPRSRPGPTTSSADLDPDWGSPGTSTIPTGASAPAGGAPLAPPSMVPLIDRLLHARPVTVLAVHAETPTAIALEVERPPGFRYRAGQFAAVTLQTDVGPDLRPLSIASSPHDPTLQFATRIGASAFKRAVADLEPGDTVRVSRPMGTFRVRPLQPAVFVTGGMGITPVRSILRQLSAAGHSQSVRLLYGTHGLEEIVYRRELEQLAAGDPKLEVTWALSCGSPAAHPTTAPAELAGECPYRPAVALLTDQRALPLSTGEVHLGRIDEALLRRQVVDLPGAVFYLTGPAAMVSEMDTVLRGLGVPRQRIRRSRQSVPSGHRRPTS